MRTQEDVAVAMKVLEAAAAELRRIGSVHEAAREEERRAREARKVAERTYIDAVSELSSVLNVDGFFAGREDD